MNDKDRQLLDLLGIILDQGVTVKQKLRSKVYQFELDDVVGKWEADKLAALNSAWSNWYLSKVGIIRME